MKTLLVMRHAKSSWKDATLDDHDRPLKKRGQKAAPKMGALLCERGLVPDLIVSSTALRAVATSKAVAEACGYVREIQLVHDLYLADAKTCVEVLRTLG